ncbi:MAG TPA: CocE/NonD family hydrolase [Stellaceae bacterium]|jgi:dienelactone hydrolase
MDRRAFLQSATLAAAAGTVTPAAAAPDTHATESRNAPASAVTGSHDWGFRHPKGAPVAKRFNEQRWVLDNVIQANGVDWDQSHTGVVIGSGGPSTIPEMNELKKRVVRLVDIEPAFIALAKEREAKAKEAEQAGNKDAAREHYYLAARYWGSAMWTVDEVDDHIQMLNNKKLENFKKYMAVADHKIEWVEFPYHGKTLPGILHLPPNYQAGSKVPVIVVVSGMDGFKEGSTALKDDRFLKRGYAVLAFEGPGYWEPPLRGIYVDVAGWAECGKLVCDWIAKRPELDVTRIGMTGVSFGSFFTAIMMSGDARFKACAITGTCYEPGGETIFNQASPTFKKRFMFMSGITDEHEFDAFRKTIDWNGYAQKIKGAYFVACGEYDQLCPLEHTEAFVKALGGAKQLVVYKGGNHSIAFTTASTQGPNPRDVQSDWLAARLDGKPFDNEYWTIDYDGSVSKAKLA